MSQVRFEKALDSFAEWCQQTPEDCPLQPDARAAVDDAPTQAHESPATAKDGREVTDGWVHTAVTASLFNQSGWPTLAEGINKLSQGNPDAVLKIADQAEGRDSEGRYQSGADASAAYVCTDHDEVPTVDQVRQMEKQFQEKYPIFGGPMVTRALGCAQWQGEQDPYPVGPAEGAPPLLVVGTIGDPATPYEWTAGLAESLGTGVEVTWNGEGHTAYPKTDCINQVVDAYLIDLTVPEEDPNCPAE